MKKFIKLTCLYIFTFVMLMNNCAATTHFLPKYSKSRTNIGSFKGEINAALRVATSPIYVVTVTRNSWGRAILTAADWITIKNCLNVLLNPPAHPHHLNFPGIHGTQGALEQYIDNNRGSLRESCKIVVFNEHFFHYNNGGIMTDQEANLFLNGGVAVGRIADIAINDSLMGLSNDSQNTIFYPHFLSKTVGDNAEITARYNSERTNGFYDYPSLVAGRRGVLPPIAASNGYFENATSCIFRGEILTKYRKRSYFNESNGDIATDNYVYNFGTGHDEAVYAGGDQLLLTIRDILLKHVRTEICFDFTNGVRKLNSWDSLSEDANNFSLLIFPANSIDPIGITQPYNHAQSRIRNLPKSSSTHEIPIIYADHDVSKNLGTNLFEVDETEKVIPFKLDEANNNTAKLLIPLGGTDIMISVYRLD